MIYINISFLIYICCDFKSKNLYKIKKKKKITVFFFFFLYLPTYLNISYINQRMFYLTKVILKKKKIFFLLSSVHMHINVNLKKKKNYYLSPIPLRPS